jgi:hypothetical protein
MPRRTTLYIDIDDTIIAQIMPGAGFDLRPCVMTQLAVLGRMYDCCWLTTWPYTEPMRTRVNDTFRYAEWDRDHPNGKAGFVLREGAPADWYWLENPLFKEEQQALAAAGKLDRYISVEPQGPWGFLDAVNELFRRSRKSATDVKHVNGRPEWFDRTAIVAG